MSEKIILFSSKQSISFLVQKEDIIYLISRDKYRSKIGNLKTPTIFLLTERTTTGGSVALRNGRRRAAMCRCLGTAACCCNSCGGEALMRSWGRVCRDSRTIHQTAWRHLLEIPGRRVGSRGGRSENESMKRKCETLVSREYSKLDLQFDLA